MKGVHNMENTLGQMIGTLNHALSITNDNKEKVSIMVKIDFTTASDIDIKSWLCGSRAIAFQRPTRMLSKTEIEALNNTTVIAQNAGQKVKSRKEQIASLTAIGLPLNVAEAAIDNPAILANIKLDAEVE